MLAAIKINWACLGWCVHVCEWVFLCSCYCEMLFCRKESAPFMFLISRASLPNDAIISPLEFGVQLFSILLAACVLLRPEAAGKTLGKRFAAVHHVRDDCIIKTIWQTRGERKNFTLSVWSVCGLVPKGEGHAHSRGNVSCVRLKKKN